MNIYRWMEETLCDMLLHNMYKCNTKPKSLKVVKHMRTYINDIILRNEISQTKGARCYISLILVNLRKGGLIHSN